MNFRRLACLSLLIASVLQAQEPGGETGWPSYGGDPGGQRFSGATQINKANVTELREVWRFALPDGPHLGKEQNSQPSLETTPVFRDGWLFLTSPFDTVLAVDAATGRKAWSYDPALHNIDPNSLIVSRGVGLWPLDASHLDRSKPCASRIFLGTLDARLIALDAVTGKPCIDFGTSGSIDLRKGVDSQSIGGYGVTSPPAVIGNIVIVGSIVGDNQRIDVQSGLVRGFDAITGRQVWSYEPLSWRKDVQPIAGGGNVWSVMSVDPRLGLVYLPTSSPALDYYGVNRPGDDRDSDSIVALQATTGRRVWAFQTVHHDLWDYDIPSQPLLFTTRDGVPALAVTTKTGQVFILDRRTGTPLIEVKERPVPASKLTGERTSPTQPFSTLPPLTEFSPVLEAKSTATYKRSDSNLRTCQQKISAVDDEGPFTPPSARGMLQFPGNLGGVNWGGAAFDPVSQTLYANVNRYPVAVFLLPRHGWGVWWRINRAFLLDWPMGIYFFLTILFVSSVLRSVRRQRKTSLSWWQVTYPGKSAILIACFFPPLFALLSYLPPSKGVPHVGYELSDQIGSPYMLERYPLVDDSGHPCASPPWGALVALNIESKTVTFREPLGTLVPGARTGSLSLGGPIVTAGGLVFDASTQDQKFRAFDAATGEELWTASLPAPGRATPMTFVAKGKQYVVIAAGGHGGTGDKLSNQLIAYALPNPHAY